MQTITDDEFHLKKSEMYRKIKGGEVFIYPTDTIYGIGCDATQESSVKTIREAKQRPTNPFSIIAPSKEWILEHCEGSKDTENWINKLPGPYSLILKLKNKGVISPAVLDGRDTISVRIPDHWTSNIAAELNIPIVTTSVNVSGKLPMTSSEDLDSEIKPKVNFMIDQGEIKGKPSKIVNLIDEETTIKEREK